MKQQKGFPTKLKKMRFEKSYPNRGKQMNVKGKSQGKRRGRPDRREDDYNAHDDFFDFD